MKQALTQQLRDAQGRPASPSARRTGTHWAVGVTHNDFVCAAKIDALRLDAG